MYKRSYMFLLPFLVPLVLFWILPLLLAFGISFTDWDYISPTYQIVGFQNYSRLFTDPSFGRALKNTAVFGLGSILPTLAIGLGLALAVSKALKSSKVYQMIFFSPWITPTVAVALVWSWIYDPERGFANHLLAMIGIEPLQWLKSSETAMLGIVIFTIWKSVGWTMMFYIGALEKVPQSAYEAARIDGANAVSQFFHITLPLISPTTFFLLIINLIQSIQVYDQIQIMTQGGPGRSTTTLLYLYYERAFQNFQMGAANAVAMVILLLLVLAIAFSFPFVWMVMGIFKTNNEIWQTPYRLLPASFDLGRVMGGLDAIHFNRYIRNSIFVGTVGSLIMIGFATCFSYAIVFLKVKYKKPLFAMVLMTYMLPGAVTYVPSYVILARLGGLDSHWGLIFSNAASVFAVFYLRQSFLKTPIEYVEAARVEGAGHFHILKNVLVPFNQPAFTTLFVLTFIQQYNNYMWPSIVLSSKENYLVSQGLRQFFIQEGAYGMNWSEIMLVSTLVILPVILIFILGQKWLMSNVGQDSGIK